MLLSEPDVKHLSEAGTYYRVPLQGHILFGEYNPMKTDTMVSVPIQGDGSHSELHGKTIKHSNLRTTWYPCVLESTTQPTFTLRDGSALLQVGIDISHEIVEGSMEPSLTHGTLDTPISMLTKNNSGYQVISSKGIVHIENIWPLDNDRTVSYCDPTYARMRFEVENHPLEGKTLDLRMNKQHMVVEGGQGNPLDKFRFLTSAPLVNKSRNHHFEYYTCQTEDSAHVSAKESEEEG